MLGLDKRAAEGLTKAVDSLIPDFIPFIDKKKILKFGLDIGLTMAESAVKLTS
jgi:hypothetical protein